MQDGNSFGGDAAFQPVCSRDTQEMLLEFGVVRCFSVLEAAGACEQVEALVLIGAVRAHQAVITDVPGAEQPNARLSDAGLLRQTVNRRHAGYICKLSGCFFEVS
jgi:hypothetical protein